VRFKEVARVRMTDAAFRESNLKEITEEKQ